MGMAMKYQLSDAFVKDFIILFDAHFEEAGIQKFLKDIEPFWADFDRLIEVHDDLEMALKDFLKYFKLDGGAYDINWFAEALNQAQLYKEDTQRFWYDFNFLEDFKKNILPGKMGIQFFEIEKDVGRYFPETYYLYAGNTTRIAEYIYMNELFDSSDDAKPDAIAQHLKVADTEFIEQIGFHDSNAIYQALETGDFIMPMMCADFLFVIIVARSYIDLKTIKDKERYQGR